MGPSLDDTHAQASASRSALFIGRMVARDHDVAAALERNAFAITSVDSVRAAFDAGREQRFDLVVVGYLVGATPALPDLIKSIRDVLQCPLVCVGPHGTDREIEESIALRAADDGGTRSRAPDRKR